VFVEREGGVEFVAAAPPSRAELYALVGRVFVRATKWLQRHGHLRDEADVSNEPHSPSFEEALVLAATGRGTMDVLRDDGKPSEPEGETHDAPGGGSTDAVTHHGFNLHAGVTVAAAADVGRERLCRYGLRPPFTLSRFRPSGAQEERHAFPSPRIDEQTKRRVGCHVRVFVDEIFRRHREARA